MNGTCNKIERVSAYHDGELSAVAAEEVERHVAECDECSVELERYRGITRRFASAELPRLPNAARRRIRRAIEDERAAGRLKIVRALTAIAASVFLVAATQVIHRQAIGNDRGGSTVRDPVTSQVMSGALLTFCRPRRRRNRRLRKTWSTVWRKAMTRSNVLALITFAVVFAAGLMVGKLDWGRGADAAAQKDAWLTSHLELTPTQQEAVRKIWHEQLKATTTSPADQWARAEMKRDAAMRKLLNPDQLPEYERILAEHVTAAAEFRASMAQQRKEAENKTKALLTPPQREKFEKLIALRAPQQDAQDR